MGYDVMRSWHQNGFNWEKNRSATDDQWSRNGLGKQNQPLPAPLTTVMSRWSPSPSNSPSSTPAHGSQSPLTNRPCSPAFELHTTVQSPMSTNPRENLPRPQTLRNLYATPVHPNEQSTAPSSLQMTPSRPQTPVSPKTMPISLREKSALASSLHHAALAGDIPHITLLLSLGADPNSTTPVPGLFDIFKPPKPGWLTPLAAAASNHQLPTVRFLLSCGADLNPPLASSAISPLHAAVRSNNYPLTSYLLMQGADLNARNAYNTTPLMYAAERGSPQLLALLLSPPYLQRLDFAAISWIGTNVTHWAVARGNPQILTMLLRAGADVDARMPDGATGLHFAVSWGFEEITRVLVGFGANLGKRDGEGRVPGEIAGSVGQKGVVGIRGFVPR